MSRKETTPMMRQFFDLKEKHPDAIMLFRCGDFYETYSTDAVEASRILGITLTHRSNKGDGAGMEMAGFPFHALETYLPKLVRAGRRVAICDQLEDPKLTKKLVKRGITELVTPGVALSDNVLNSRENNFLAAVLVGKAACGLALLDISTGEFMVAEGTIKYIDKLLENFAPKEVLVPQAKKAFFETNFGHGYFVFPLEDWAFGEASARDTLTKHFAVRNLKGFGVEHLHDGIAAAGAVMQYLQMTLHTQMGHITSIVQIEEERFVRLDKFTVRNLELVRPMSESGTSLLGVLDRTITPMGARLMHRRLLFPLREPSAVESRLDKVEYFFRKPEFAEVCHTSLSQIGDLERLASKIATTRISPREMQQLRLALDAIVPLREACLNAEDQGFREIGLKLDPTDDLRTRIARELTLNPPILLSKGGVIAKGVNDELDELRSIAHSGKDFLLEIQNREIESTGIQSLKIGFNNVFGYYIEVRNTYKDRVPDTWIRKQTLVNAERYITEELKAYEEKILGAEDKILQLEQRLYDSLVAEAARHIAAVQHDATLLAEIDCYHSFSVAAREHRYVRPVMNDTITTDIKAGRHPVIETRMPAGESYVANDVYLDSERQQVIMLTGPNMAGKSALLRQTALITLMAQAGSFVPAESATLGMVDKIFTRVGASDNISSGESTFMVEMNEAANIMNNITPRSLVLFDELGRGTSTYDGISLAWAIVEHIHESPRCRARTLFATHYHELNDMETLYPRIRNFNVSVREIDGHVVFLRKLVPGGSEHSFGIHVAKLAGMPPGIVKRAEEILHDLEAHSAGHESVSQRTSSSPTPEGTQLSFFQLDDPVLSQIRDELLTLDINNLTPLEALNKLSSIKKIIGGKD